MKVLVTGVAGFIGAALAQLLLDKGHTVMGIDNLNDYYDVTLKKARLDLLKPNPNFQFQLLDLNDAAGLSALFQSQHFDGVVNLAAQAGVRHSFEHPRDYIDSNIIGFFNILECCRQNMPKHLVYASSSSVYGGTQEKPSKETLKIDKPLSLYAASKKCNELMAYSYASLFNIPVTGLRFFSVYGPWGRPDMALFKFVKNIYARQPIELYNHGQMFRDFTYIDDIVNGIYQVLLTVPTTDGEDPTSSRVYNIGRGKPVSLMEFVAAIENEVGQKAIIENLPMQAGDVVGSHADITALAKEVGYVPSVEVKTGIQNFVNWYKDYYGAGVILPQ